MDEYIDREKMIADLEEEIEYGSGMYTKEQNDFLNKGLRIALKDVKHMRCEDVVPVVRCCNCIHLKTNTSKKNYCDIHSTTWDKFYVRLDDYCSYGERK